MKLIPPYSLTKIFLCCPLLSNLKDLVERIEREERKENEKKKKQGKLGYREKDGPQKFTALEIDEWQIPSVVAKLLDMGTYCRKGVLL